MPPEDRIGSAMKAARPPRGLAVDQVEPVVEFALPVELAALFVNRGR